MVQLQRVLRSSAVYNHSSHKIEHVVFPPVPPLVLRSAQGADQSAPMPADG